MSEGLRARPRRENPRGGKDHHVQPVPSTTWSARAAGAVDVPHKASVRVPRRGHPKTGAGGGEDCVCPAPAICSPWFSNQCKPTHRGLVLACALFGPWPCRAQARRQLACTAGVGYPGPTASSSWAATGACCMRPKRLAATSHMWIHSNKNKTGAARVRSFMICPHFIFVKLLLARHLFLQWASCPTTGCLGSLAS